VEIISVQLVIETNETALMNDIAVATAKDTNNRAVHDSTTLTY